MTAVYVVVEGRSEKIVLSTWIPAINPKLREVEHVADVVPDTFVIVEGGGMPQYYDVIAAAVEDVNANPNVARLVICVDSEDFTRDEKLTELKAFIDPLGCAAEVRLVIHHFCFETWALGNPRAMPNTVHDQRLKIFRKHFDVSKRDPELLKPLPDSDLNRAQTALSYLRAMISVKYPKASYSKSSPGPVAHTSYLRNLRLRCDSTGHISSFRDVIDAFV